MVEEIGEMCQQFGKDYVVGELLNVDWESFVDIDVGLVKLEWDWCSMVQKVGKDLCCDGDQLVLWIFVGEIILEVDVNVFYWVIQVVLDVEGVVVFVLWWMWVVQVFKIQFLVVVCYNLKDLVMCEDGMVDLDDLVFVCDLVVCQEKVLIIDFLSVVECYGIILVVSDFLDVVQVGGIVLVVVEWIDVVYVVVDYFDICLKYFKVDELV